MQMYKHRPYRDVSDVGRMKLIAGRNWIRLEWVVYGPHGLPPPDRIIELWEDEQGVLVGWVLLTPADGFEFRVTQELRGSNLEHAIVEWGERAILGWRNANGLGAHCVIECWSEDRTRIEIVTGRGYRPSDVGEILFSRGLDDEIPPPAPPGGWVARGLSDAEVDSRADAEYEAFSPGSKTTPATWRHLMANAPGYEVELDNVAVSSEGIVGAAALVWLDAENKIGEFVRVGTRPAFQRRGLGRAVLLRGLAKMRERGMETAIVATNATNAPAIALYQSVGFEIRSRSIEYILTLEPSRAE